MFICIHHHASDHAELWQSHDDDDVDRGDKFEKLVCKSDTSEEKGKSWKKGNASIVITSLFDEEGYD